MKSRLYILLFSSAIFLLTAIGLVVLYIGKTVLTFWFIFAFLIALPCVFVFFVQPLFTGERKLSGKKIVLLTLVVTLMGVVVTHSVWTIVTPRWSFSVTTDKFTYILGENVKITVSLRNIGFIAHSFKSSLSDPVVVSIETHEVMQVWYSPYHLNITEFKIPAQQSLERAFIWNQTNIHLPEKGIEPNKYYIVAFIPAATSNDRFWNRIFSAETSINITSP